MNRITLQQFLVNQPSFPEETSTDSFYLQVAEKLLSEVLKIESAAGRWPETVLRASALVAIGYFQDIVADAGVWRGFISEHRRLYNGRTLPFYEISDDYIDFELNQEDVRFIVWYSLAMLYEHTRDLSPADCDVALISEKWFEIMEESYEEAPMPEDFHLSHALEVHDPEESERVARLAHWLYLHCWLLRPANAMTMAEVAAELPEGEEGRKELAERLDKAMNEFPTGPLALFLREWLWLVCEDRMPPQRRRPAEEKTEHPYYAPFMTATGGKRIAYFGTYQELNQFFIDALGWSAGEDHLAQMKPFKDFVLLVNPEKGMLLAKEVAACIADPDNALYDQEYARANAFQLLAVRGRCPIDLVKYVCEHGWLPDAHFPTDDSTDLVSENWDFIARCYLQQYYRGD